METSLKDVVAAALRKCRQQGSSADILELAYAACIIEQQRSWGPATAAAAAENDTQLPNLTLRNGSKLSDDALAAMAEHLAQHILAPDDAAAALTARLQIALEKSYKQQQDKVEHEQEQQAAEASRLASAVAYKKVTLQIAGLPEYQAVFNAVLDYVCAAMGVAAKTAVDAAARAQVSSAMESAFPLSGLAYFLTLTAQERLQQMETLAHVTCGICLHNAYTGEDSVSLLPPSATVQLPQAERLLQSIRTAAAEAEAALNQYNSCSKSYSGDTSSSGSRSKPGVALFCCQAAVALRRLAADLSAGINCCRALDEGVAAALSQASQLVSTSLNGVAKDAVFPLFESAGRLHLALTGELRLLLVRARLWEDTCIALNAAAEDPTAAVPRVLGFKPRLGRVPSINWCSHTGSSAADSKGLSAAQQAELPAYVEYVSPAAIAAATVAGTETASAVGTGADGSSIGELALACVCPASLARSAAAGANAAGTGSADDCIGGDLLLIGKLADPSFGYIRYAGALYGFSSIEALQSFVDSPALTLDAVTQAVHHTPLLAHMLGLTGSSAAAAAAGSAVTGSQGESGPAGTLSSNDPISKINSPGVSSSMGIAAEGMAVLPLRRLLALFSAAPVKVDAETQTPTHFIEKHIDVDYDWNEWALRRRIIALANLRMKATHSAQTVLSHFRRDGDSQTWLPKTVAVQTKVNKGSTMPRKLRYVTGLRGAPETVKMKVVSLDLDIGQTHQF